MSSAVRLTNHTFNGQAWSSKRLTSIVQILTSETDNCPSWISGRERMTIESTSWSVFTKECCRLGGGWTCNLLLTRQTRSQLSHRGRPNQNWNKNLPSWLKFDGVKDPNAPRIICCSGKYHFYSFLIYIDFTACIHAIYQWDKISQNLAHLEGNAHKKYKSHRIFS